MYTLFLYAEGHGFPQSQVITKQQAQDCLDGKAGCIEFLDPATQGQRWFLVAGEPAKIDAVPARRILE